LCKRYPPPFPLIFVFEGPLGLAAGTARTKPRHARTDEQSRREREREMPRFMVRQQQGLRIVKSIHARQERNRERRGC